MFDILLSICTIFAEDRLQFSVVFIWYRWLFFILHFYAVALNTTKSTFIMEMTPRTPEFDRLAFTVLAIEASAQKMGISPSEMRRRLERVGLVKSLIQDCYDTLHTESREAVANDVVEALKNWERAD